MIKQISNSYCCVGLMSGTSLDGLDLVLCQLDFSNNTWEYKLIKTRTKPYSEYWLKALKNALELGGEDLMRLNREYGKWLGEQVKDFIEGEEKVPDFVASHGHTLFHDPENQFNFQLGDGAALAAACGLTTVCDFRSMDVCLKGQGAPLVPIGDAYLFSEYDACVNLGGFANVSVKLNDKRRAWDICPVNTVLNKLTNYLCLPFDYNGEIGRKGEVLPGLLKQLNILPYYQETCPKSLANEWLIEQFYPCVNSFINESVPDLLRTCYEHFSLQIASDINKVTNGKILFTGGGAYNTFLIELIQSKLSGELIIPSSDLVEYKEALIFAFLGALRISNQMNCLQEVTGADNDSCSGAVYSGK
ncbi:anhydro-N-acetylmuramic acid kinase [Carboxylicivirga sp. N1Y90]|uniref:anhydro-N-acetylmuramic acid kinase n=1 Tax=Carboxylicivirga fragile TaxID=3417571 RepID=UPI003D334789|nr:anhydro-N-acetylmuramic acid kinase [Marinilabiliaceae bacterium N1Y90]